MNSPAAGSQANTGGGNYSLSPRAAGGTGGSIQQSSPSKLSYFLVLTVDAIKNWPFFCQICSAV